VQAAPDANRRSAVDRPIATNLVPATDIDRYAFHIDDNLDLLCNGSLTVTLTAPKGAAMHLDLLQAPSWAPPPPRADGRARSCSRTVLLGRRRLRPDGAGHLEQRRPPAANYRLERSGSF
jgi:hypothetical protein